MPKKRTKTEAIAVKRLDKQVVDELYAVMLTTDTSPRKLSESMGRDRSWAYLVKSRGGLKTTSTIANAFNAMGYDIDIRATRRGG